MLSDFYFYVKGFPLPLLSDIFSKEPFVLT